MAVVVMVHAKLRDPASAQQLHDSVTGATKDQAKAAGDLSHKTYRDPQDPTKFLGIDVWESPEKFEAFASNPQIAEFFGGLFDGQPDVSVWVDSGWNAW
jgi:quinol monooxygenase YgiN